MTNYEVEMSIDNKPLSQTDIEDWMLKDEDTLSTEEKLVLTMYMTTS